MKGRLLHYEILREIGRGGMGEVYQARDTHLDRVVAVKVLPAGAVANPSRKLRFIQEAKAASALNHPNIVTIHDINADEGIDFIVMEYVAGKTLDEVIPVKGLRPNAALKHAVPIADALAAAHAAGILHRDLKPSNVMVTEEGRVKVLDFGLAKLVEPAEGSSSDETRTSSRPRSEDGVVMGTAAYMSPEQAEGRRLDGRSDVFSFGAMLYEMVTGQKPFQGDSKLATMAKILNEDPAPPSQLLESIPPDLEKTILRCLRKDPARRYQTMADLKVALEDLRDETASGKQQAVQRKPIRPWRRMGAVAAALLAVAAGFLAWRGVRGRGPEQMKAVPLTAYQGAEILPSFSPDGNQVAFQWSGPQQDNLDIYILLIGSLTPLRLTSDPSADTSPAWSPDGRWIAFLRRKASGGNELRLIQPLGGPERKLTEVRTQHSVLPPYVAWSLDSKFLVVTDAGGPQRPDALFVVSVETGEKRPLTQPQPPAFGDSMPAVAPDGRSLLFRRALAMGSGEIHWLPLREDFTAGGESRPVTPVKLDARHPAWLPDGREVVFTARGNLWRIPVRGNAAPVRLAFVGEDGAMAAISRPPPGKPARLVYVRSSHDTNIWRVETSRPGAPATSPPVPVISSTRVDTNPKLSPDGRRVVFASDRSGEMEIWLADPDGGNAVPLTSLGVTSSGSPRWSPDGQTIVFDSNLEGPVEIYVVPASGGRPRPLTFPPANARTPSFSSDGKWVYFNSTRSGENQVWKVPAEGGKPVQVTRQGGYLALESPDGTYLYYTLAPVAASTVWRMPAAGGEPVKVLEGVVQHAFAPLNEGIYYVVQPGRSPARLEYLDFATGRSTTVAALGPRPSFGFTVSADGRTILYPHVDSSVDDLMLVENFR